MHKLQLVLIWILLGLILLANLGLYFTHSIPMSNLSDSSMRDAIFNSDTLELVALYKDIVLNNGSFSQWYWTPTPYFFPDMFLYYISEKLTGNFYYAIAVFFTLENIFLIAIIYLIFREFLTSISAWMYTLIVMVVLYFFPTMTYSLQFISTFHYSEFLVSLASLYLILKIFTSKNRYILFLFLWISISLLMVMSDRLYILHFLLPMITSIIFWGILNPKIWKKIFIIISLSIIIIFIGEWLSVFLVPNEIIYPDLAHPHLAFSAFSKNILLIRDIGLDAFEKYQINFILVIIANLIIIYYLLSKVLYFIQKKILLFEDEKRIFIAIFLFAMILGTLLAIGLKSNNQVEVRHMIGLFMLPIILSPIYISLYLATKSKILIYYFRWILLGIILLSLLWNIRNNLIHKTFYSDYTTPMSECIDNFIEETGAKVGIAQYWQSKKYYILSKHSILLAQFDRTLHPYRWVTTVGWYKNRYDFALIDHTAVKNYYKINDYLIRERNGQEDKMYKCGTTDILYYKNGFEL